MMKIRVDVKLLEEQIHMCDIKATYGDKYEEDIFEGISNLLSEISYALTFDKEIEFEKVEEEE